MFVSDNGLYVVSTWDWYEYLNFTPATDLVTPNGPIVALHPGLNTGPVDVQTVFTSAAPAHLHPGIDGRAWADVIEVSAHFPEAPVSVVTATEGSVEDITAGSDGNFRLRVHAVGRAEARDGAFKTVMEHYLIQLWLEPLSSPQVLVAATAAVNLAN